jgi:predicted TIM-barrel fold metal-dependent hydrolase
MICDAHCHFFSRRFLEILTAGSVHQAVGVDEVSRSLGWDPPGEPAALADRWVEELDRHHVGRAAIIASVPGDEGSVSAAVARHPDRLVGFFMFNPSVADAAQRLDAALSSGLRGICLFPAMHRYALDDERVAATFTAARTRGAAVFVHCGALTVGVRRKLGLSSPFDWRLGDPLAVAAVASRFPEVPVIIPHFGAGFLQEALMAADQCPNVHLDTSSSNGWMKYHPGLTLEAVFKQALAAAGPDRLLFGTDSSFFPRGWQAAIYDAQHAALHAAGVDAEIQRRIFGGNFERLFAR